MIGNKGRKGLSFSSRCDINTGVSQGSILGPLLFNIFINDLFFSVTKSGVCDFADDNTLYSCNKNLKHVFSNLKYGFRNVLNWFKINSMTTNLSKFHFYLELKIKRHLDLMSTVKLFPVLMK